MVRLAISFEGMTSEVGADLSVPLSRVSRYRPEIDGLRAFAVGSVILNHFNKQLLPGGYLGVDIFVISGYVIPHPFLANQWGFGILLVVFMSEGLSD